MSHSSYRSMVSRVWLVMLEMESVRYGWGFPDLVFLSSKVLLSHVFLRNWHWNYKKREIGNWHVKIIPNSNRYNIHPTPSFFSACQITKQQIGHHNHFSTLNQIQFSCPRSLIIPSIIWDSFVFKMTLLTLKSPSFKSKSNSDKHIFTFTQIDRYI